MRIFRVTVPAFSTALLATSALIANCFGQNPSPVVRNFDSQELTSTYYSEGVAVGDLDGDNVNDVVYGPYWFKGPDFSQKFEIYPAKPQPMEGYADHFFAWIHDFNNDSFNDVFVVGFPGTAAYVYENPGRQASESEHWTKHETIDWVSNESPQFVNLVGDTAPELVCTRDGFFGFATIDWTQPFTKWSFHPISEKIAAERFGHALGVGDVNGDSLQDVIFAEGWFEQPRSGALDGRWLLHSTKFSDAYGGADMFAYDVDGDGDNDVITSEAAHDYGLAWYEQVGEADGEITFERHLIMGSQPAENRYGVAFSELHSVALADINGDGLKDICTGKTYYSHHQQSPGWNDGAVVYWFELKRGSDGVDWIPHEATDKPGIGRQLVVADINRDGLLDFASGGMLGAHVVTQKLSPVTLDEYLAAQPKPYTGPAIREGKPIRGKRIALGGDGRADKAIEGEELNAAVTGGEASAQAMGGFPAGQWSNNNQLWWTGGKIEDKLTIELNAFKNISSIQMALTCARDYGTIEISIDDEPLTDPIDCYDENVTSTGVLEFETDKLDEGAHKLTFEIVGKNPKAAPGYMVGIDFVRFKSAGQEFAEPEFGYRATGENGQPLNLGFENGTLDDWTADGEAFSGQPIHGDAVSARRDDMASQHEGEYWIGTFEKSGDAVKGTLTSESFTAGRYATFLLGGGSKDETRVELFVEGEDKPFYTARGNDAENMSLVVANLERAQGKRMFIKITDDSTNGWGHVNFDDFRLHETRPGPLTPSSIALVADEYPHSGLEASAAAAAMKLPEGFSVSVLAAEPDVKQPIAMAFDDRGRTWIAEAYEYPQRADGDEGRDRILIFEDTNGDGKFDSRKVFAEGLNLVSGLEVGFGGVWIGAAPYLMFIPDADGDDVPDAAPQILLDGWGYEDTHETLNAFCWGPDGWLYGCHGVFTHSNVGKPGAADSERTRINAGIWRFHPTQHSFEVFAHGTSNPWGVDFDKYGEAFATACVIPHLYHLIPGARYQRQAGQHFNPNTYADIQTIADHLHYLGANPHGGNGKSDEAGGGHAHAGAMIYQGGVWPEQFDGVLFMNNIHGQRLNTDILENHGSGYVGHHGPDFLLTGDVASQILNFRYGPDGQVTMIDWYDMQACHRKEVEVHDRSNGRIYKISYGAAKSSPVDLSKQSDMDLVDSCFKANNWYFKHARRLLQERASAGTVQAAAISKLMEVATTHSDDAMRLRAIWALGSVSRLENSFVGRLLKDASPHVRAWAVRETAQQRDFKLTSDEVATLNQLAISDESPVVRLSIASVTGKLPNDQRWDIVASLAAHAEDANDHNLPLVIWYAMEPLADVDTDRALALGMTAGNTMPQLRSFMLKRVAGSGGGEAVQRLVSGINSTDSADLQLSFIDAIRTSLSGQRQAEKPSNWDEAYPKLLKSEDERVKLQATALGVTFGDAAAMSQLRKNLLDDKVGTESKLESLESLLGAKDADLVGTLGELIAAESSDTAVRTAAIRGLAQYDSQETQQLLIDNYLRLTAEERAAAVATLSSRASGATKLLNAIDAGSIAVTDLSADLARQIEYLDDAKLTEQLTKTWGTVRKSSADKTKLIEQYAELVSRTDIPEPDVAHGRVVFSKTCQRCHTLYGVGEKLGPDLTGSNRSNLDYLLENIVDPSAVMANEYRQSIFLTDDGQVVTGIVRDENENAVTVQTADATVIIPKDEIEQRHASDLSMMPENQLAQFSETEIRDLVAYLREKSQSPMLATTENAQQLFNGNDLSGWSGNSDVWSVDNGEIVGKSEGLKENEFLVSDLLTEDFKLSLEVKLIGNVGNSGVQFRSKVRDDGLVQGYQADVGEGWWGKLYEEHGRGLLWDKSGEQFLKSGDWNLYEIECEAHHVRTWLNGNLCVDIDDEPGELRGITAVQVHSGGATEVRFRNLKLEIK